VANLGVDGYTSADLIHDELPELASLRPGFVSVLIGVNDVVQGVSPSRYAANLAAIFDALAVHVPADRTVAVGTPDYTVTPAGADYGEPVARRAAIEACNGLLDRVARSRGITVVGTWDISRRAATEISLVARDGLHPSGRQYELWVDAIAPAVERLLAPG
jgi:lysophospholipase L1-like esterase